MNPAHAFSRSVFRRHRITEPADLYTSGDVAHPLIADYPGSTLRIYKRPFNGLPWPLWQMLVLPERKLAYNPIAKSGSSSLRAAIVARSTIGDALKTLPADTHTTGLQLGDLPKEQALDILHDPAYLRFSVIRDPFDRLVSAYLEKFVVNRRALNNQFHTRTVIAAVLGRRSTTPDDFERSISFAEFVDYVCDQPPERLDPHWCPQYLYLRSAMQRLFRLEDLAGVAAVLGVGADILKRNVTRTNPQPLPGAHRLAARDLAGADIATDSFYDARLRSRVESYFALDFTLRDAVGGSKAH